MLWDVHRNREMTRIPHKGDYDVWASRLTDAQKKAIKDEILLRIKGDEVATAGWIPGSDWAGTPFDAIWDVACQRNVEAAGKCFGLFVWETLMEHEDYWGFGKYDLKNVPIESMTYFKVNPAGTRRGHGA